MDCEKCGRDTKVTETRTPAQADSYLTKKAEATLTSLGFLNASYRVRSRECKGCGAVMTTIELSLDTLHEVTMTGRRVGFAEKARDRKRYQNNGGTLTMQDGSRYFLTLMEDAK